MEHMKCEVLMSDHDKSYRRRFSTDGGEYLLIPRDDDFPDFPELTDVPMRAVLSIPLLPGSRPEAGSSTEVENMVEAFFASIATKGENVL
jgi:hypothetical protein